MSQNSMVINDGSGAAVLAAINNAMNTLVGLNSGASAPTVTYPYMWWADTTSGLLKQRNAADTAWVSKGALAGVFAAGGANADITSMTGLTAPTVAANPVRATDIQNQTVTSATTGGTSTAYTLTPTTALAAYAAGVEYDVTFHTASGANPVLTISGLASAPTLVKRDTNNTLSNIAANDLPPGWRSKVVLLNATQALVRELPILQRLTNSLSADVVLNNTSAYFDGPSIAQGTSGTWFVSGTVTVIDTSSGANFAAKLWDGTNIIASAAQTSVSLGKYVAISLSGVISSPVGNLRISVSDLTSVNGFIKWDAGSAGNLKDSTITAVRIA